jgi:hypothetical protein
LPRRDAERAVLEHRLHQPPPRRYRELDPSALDCRPGLWRGGRGEHSAANSKGSGRGGSSPGGVGAAAKGRGAAGEAVRHRRRRRGR